MRNSASFTSKWKWLIPGAVLALDVFTLVGGWQSHSAELDSRAWQMWRGESERLGRLQGRAGSDVEGLRTMKLFPGGPHTHVSCCAPVLPGVLLVKSSYVIGPLWGGGGVKIVLFYGFGSRELATLFGWIS